MKYLTQQIFSAFGIPPDGLKPDLGSRAAAEVEADSFTKRLDTVLNGFWSLPWPEPIIVIHTGKIYQAYAAWYNHRHPTRKINWRRLNRIQRKEAMQRWLKR